jgi:UDP-sugar transporter A1/2/3
MVALVFQNTSLVILLKLTFRKDAKPYASSSVVLVTELLKLTACSCVAAHQSKRNLVRTLAIRSDQRLIFVPSGLYVIQNNLLFLGAKLLPSVIYVVCTQIKIPATAFMSRLILGTRLSGVKYASLFFLSVGIFLVQLNEEKSASSTPQEGNLTSGLIGMTAVFFASFISGTAGILLEKIYKGKKGSDQQEHTETLGKKGVKYTVWTRNIQLSLISLPFALFGAILQYDESTRALDFLRGFDGYVWGVVICQAAGGIIVAFVMKFANNILKCLAVAISICFCAFYSVATGDLDVTMSLVLGILFVTASVYVFPTDVQVLHLSDVGCQNGDNV